MDEGTLSSHDSLLPAPATASPSHPPFWPLAFLAILLNRVTARITVPPTALAK